MLSRDLETIGKRGDVNGRMPQMSRRILHYFYGHDFMDGVGVEFYRVLRRHVRAECMVLDLGAGPGEARTDLRDSQCVHIGLDVDPLIRENVALDFKVVGSAESMPFASEKFDLVFADFVMEHVVEHEKVVSEIWRILKPGGVFLFHTPNLYHYAPVASRITTPAIHRRVLNRLEAQLGRTLGQAHPVVYRFNSKRAISRSLKRAGFKNWELRYSESEPYYLAISWPLLLGGVLYERIVNRFTVLRSFRVAIFGTCRK